MNGALLKELRKQAGLTQSELGNKLGVIKQTVSNWENGISSPGNDLLTQLANIFDVSTDYLLGNKEATRSPEQFPNNPNSSLSHFVGITGYGMEELSEKLNISEDILYDYLDGTVAVPYSVLDQLSDLCEISTDCLLGIRKTSRGKDFDNLIPFKYNYKIAERIQALLIKTNTSDNFLKNLLTLTDTEVYQLKEYGFVPHMNTIIELAKYFHVSCDYLLCQIDEQDEKALSTFKQLNDDNKDIIVGDMKKALRDQKIEESVAADRELRPAK